MERHIVDVEAEASEANRDMDPPPGVKVTRPGRTTVFSVRLGESEYERLSALADDRGLPVSTMARSLLIQSLRAHAEGDPMHDAVVRALRETLRPDVLTKAS